MLTACIALETVVEYYVSGITGNTKSNSHNFSGVMQKYYSHIVIIF